MSDVNLTIYPALIVGLGGTGQNVVRYVKRRFLRTWNEAGTRARSDATGRADGEYDIDDLPSLLQLLAVDTEPLVNKPDDEPLYFHEFAFLGKFDAARLIQNRTKHGEYLNWWGWGDDELPLGYIHNGAKQLRPIGRLAFFRNYVTFRSMLQEKIRSMREDTAIAEAQERGFAVQATQPLIYIVSSLCGGTGAGMFLDAAHVVKHYFGVEGKVVGILMMPSVFEKTVRSDLQQRRIQANAYAALRELNHYQLNPTFGCRYPSERGELPTTKRKPFDHVFLVERQDEAGQRLATKAAAEQMAAHLISLTVFSHLNSQILGEGANITEERKNQTSNGRRSRTLAYSTFGVAALIIPRDALWRYFRARTVERVLQTLVYGQSDQENPAETIRKALISDVIDQFRRTIRMGEGKPASQEAAVNKLQQDLNHDEGGWTTIRDKLDTAAADALKNGGLDGLRTLMQTCVVAEGEQEGEIQFRPGYLHDHNLVFKACGPQIKHNAGPLAPVANLLSPRSAKIEKQADMWDRRAEVWKQVVDKLVARAWDWLRYVDVLDQEVEDVLGKVQSDVKSATQQIDPFRRNGDRNTETVYDLENGAVGEDHLREFWRRTSELLEQEPPINERDDDTEYAETDGRPPLTRMLDAIYEIVEQGPTTDPMGIRDIVLGEIDAIQGLRRRVDLAFDLRNIVQIQHGNGHRPANHRIDQLFSRVYPHATVDGDIAQYSEADQEHIRLVTTPPVEGGSTNGKAKRDSFDQALRGYSEFTKIQSDDPDRIDACHIVHGLPVAQLSSIGELYRQYTSDDFDQRTLHINPDWVTTLIPLYGETESDEVVSESEGADVALPPSKPSSTGSSTHSAEPSAGPPGPLNPPSSSAGPRPRRDI